MGSVECHVTYVSFRKCDSVLVVVQDIDVVKTED